MQRYSYSKIHNRELTLCIFLTAKSHDTKHFFIHFAESNKKYLEKYMNLPKVFTLP